MTAKTRIRRKAQVIDLGSGVEVVVRYAAEDRPKIQWNDNKLVVIAGDEALPEPTWQELHAPAVPAQSSLKPVTPEQQALLKSRGYFEDKKKKENPSAALFEQEFGEKGAEIFKETMRSAMEPDA